MVPNQKTKNIRQIKNTLQRFDRKIGKILAGRTSNYN